MTSGCLRAEIGTRWVSRVWEILMIFYDDGVYDPNDFTDIYKIQDIHDIYSDDYTNNGGDKS